MKVYKHYSFDLWLTLIRSNPDFKKQRAKYFYQHYNFNHKTLLKVETIFRQVDLMCNAMNERSGKNIDADEMYLMVISMLNDHQSNLRDIDLAELEKDMEAMLFNYLPQVYSSETILHLERIKYVGDPSVSLLCNTGFIRGATLRKVLKELSLDQYLDFQLYSDEEGMSKPNIRFFELMLNMIDRKRHKALKLNEVVHIGDNLYADYWGAKAVGIDSIVINSNELTISCL
jgi:putative hydrolase of the HAD superfamily